jgi:hypothetical protein
MKLSTAIERADQNSISLGGVWYVHTNDKTSELVLTMTDRLEGMQCRYASEEPSDDSGLTETDDNGAVAGDGG